MSAAADLTNMIEEEKKSQDSTSQKDVDAVLWSDDPENAYFQQMMNEKGGEDSTLGNSAFDQMYNSRERTNTEDDSMFRSDPNAPFRLAILGPEDDLSTMAGDTISGSVVTEGAVFSNANLPAVISSKNPSRNEPVQRDFKEYELKTPVKQKKRRWYPYMRREEDEDTQPESPPAAICISDKDKVVQIDGEIQEKDGDASTYVTYTRPSKRIFVCAAAMGAVLILLIGGLAIAYIQVNNDENSDSSSSSSTALEQPVGGFKPEDFAPTVPVSVPAPTDDYTTTPASLGPTPAPAVVPTKAPVPVPVTEQANLVNVLANNGVDVTNLLDEMESPQYRALRWLASDPSYYDYTEPRLVQRWVLAVVALGMYNDESKTNTAASVLPQWLDYDINECEWFTTSIQTVCTGFGYYRQLELRDQQFYGTIPTELGLLSNSLGKWQV